MNHSRPNLKALDNLKRELRCIQPKALDAPLPRAVASSTPFPWEKITPPCGPDQDSNLSADQANTINYILSSHREYSLQIGRYSPLIRKQSEKGKMAIAQAEEKLFNDSLTFIKYCAKECGSGKSTTLQWIQRYINSHLENGNVIFEYLGNAIFGVGLERYFYSIIDDDSETAQAELFAFFGAHIAS